MPKYIDGFIVKPDDLAAWLHYGEKINGPMYPGSRVTIGLYIEPQ